MWLTFFVPGVAGSKGCRHAPKKFPVEFKRDVVTAARRVDLTITEVAADFDVALASVRGLKHPGFDGGSEPTKGLGHASTEEVSA